MCVAIASLINIIMFISTKPQQKNITTLMAVKLFTCTSHLKQ